MAKTPSRKGDAKRVQKSKDPKPARPKSAKPKNKSANNAGIAAPNKAAGKLLKTPKPGQSWIKWIVRRLFIICAILIAIPVFLTLIYKPSSVHPVSTLMLSERVTGKTVKRDWVPLSAVSPVLWQSVMMSEDGQFCAHSGVDWQQVNLVIDDVMEGEKVRGASTISMQTVKNLYLWSSRSYIRKVLEVPLAMMVDFVWGKKRVMEIYLNIAEWGPGIYGIEAAAQHHFKRSAKRLSRRQAALLAVTLPNPKLRNPRKPSRGMSRLARLVERRARASGAYIGCLR